MSQNIKLMQQALAGLGWDPGPIDGVFGAKTAAAARDFAASRAGSPAPALPPAAATPAPSAQPSGGQRRIALIVGHTSRQPGAVRITDGESEYNYNSALAREVQSYLKAAGHSAIVITRQPQLGYGAQIKTAYAEADEWGASATIEFHFNSAASSSATGTETLTSGSPKSRALAKELNDRMVSALGLKDRGLLVRSRNDRGGESLFSGKAPAALIEPYFGSNARDCATADRFRAQLVAAIAEGALVI